MNIGMWVGIGLAVACGVLAAYSLHKAAHERWGEGGAGMFGFFFFGAIAVLGVVVLGISAAVAYADPVVPPSGYCLHVYREEISQMRAIATADVSQRDRQAEVQLTIHAARASELAQSCPGLD